MVNFLILIKFINKSHPQNPKTPKPQNPKKASYFINGSLVRGNGETGFFLEANVI